eukprot:gene18817-biopygen11489
MPRCSGSTTIFELRATRVTKARYDGSRRPPDRNGLDGHGTGMDAVERSFCRVAQWTGRGSHRPAGQARRARPAGPRRHNKAIKRKRKRKKRKGGFPAGPRSQCP